MVCVHVWACVCDCDLKTQLLCMTVLCVCDHNVWGGGLLPGLPLLAEQRLLSGRASCDLRCWGRKMDCIQIQAGDSSDTRLFWEWRSKIKSSRPTDQIYVYTISDKKWTKCHVGHSYSLQEITALVDTLPSWRRHVWSAVSAPRVYHLEPIRICTR